MTSIDEVVRTIITTQAELANHIFQKRRIQGLPDWCGMLEERPDLSPTIESWILNMSRALDHEMYEALDALEKLRVADLESDTRHEVPVLFQKLQLEIVDMIHFAASICILTGDTDESVIGTHVNKLRASITERVRDLPPYSRYATMKSMLQTVGEERISLEHKLNWKWWSNYEVPDRLSLSLQATSILGWLLYVFLENGGTTKDLQETYEKKARINKERQEKEYSRSLKTEDDNNKAASELAASVK